MSKEHVLSGAVRRALRFYANSDNHKHIDGSVPVLEDSGTLARTLAADAARLGATGAVGLSALAFYADPGNWCGPDDASCPVLADAGAVARDALEKELAA